VSPEDLKYISRQHLMIRTEEDKYFVEDLNSANGTKTNGSDIRGKSRQELKDGDRIEVADVVALTFKA
jgi:pSer/pThr/pTyr-binding forkhead associated (FHA) protein